MLPPSVKDDTVSSIIYSLKTSYCTKSSNYSCFGYDICPCRCMFPVFCYVEISYYLPKILCLSFSWCSMSISYFCRGSLVRIHMQEKYYGRLFLNKGILVLAFLVVLYMFFQGSEFL